MMDCLKGCVVGLLFVLFVTTTSATENESLYDILNNCHLNLSQSYLDYQSTELLELIEPMLAFLNGSYNQWLLERSLKQELDPPIPFDFVEDMFEEYSFNSTVLPQLETHCRTVSTELQSCLVEAMNSSHFTERNIVIELVNGLSERYCNGTTPKSDILAELTNDYLPIGDLYEVIWPLEEDMGQAEELEKGCGSLSQLTESLLEITKRNNSLLVAIDDVKETMLTTIRCYAVLLNEQHILSENIKELMVDLTSLTMQMDRTNVHLLQYTRSMPTKTVQHVKVTKEPKSMQKQQESKGSRTLGHWFMFIISFYLLLAL